LDVKAVHSKDYDQDTCELSLGSSELVLTDGDVVTVNGEDIDGSEVTLTRIRNMVCSCNSVGDGRESTLMNIPKEGQHGLTRSLVTLR
jgi:hypothetical protein